MDKFADRLKELRLEKGLKQEALAKDIGYSQSTIAKWENESRSPNKQAILSIAKYFGVTTDYLLGMTDY